MSNGERVWSSKTNYEVLEAAEHLSDYAEEDERLIREELRRRGMADPPPTVRSTNETPVITQVALVDIQMPFLSMVIFSLKWAIAAIPAGVLLVLVFTTRCAGLSFGRLRGVLLFFTGPAGNETALEPPAGRSFTLKLALCKMDDKRR